MRKKIVLPILAIIGAFTCGAVTPRPMTTILSDSPGIDTDNFFNISVKANKTDSVRIMDYASGSNVLKPGKTAENAVPVSLRIYDDVDGVTGSEGYRLLVGSDGVKVDATDGAGLFYGLVTLEQLALENDTIPALEIIDNPRFGYRGLMLDISRHFRDKDFIKKQIDAMAALKLNRLHLHLTDAAGWRIEIERYPRLTEYAAWRPALTWKDWRDGGYKYTESTDPLAHGGFLTKDDVKEIVEYAADRYIAVIPEIEMPSHSEEVTAAYPFLGCGNMKQADFCVGNPETLTFLKGVLDEVCEMFPGEYIHIGGDEASMSAWKDCERCEALMRKEGMKEPVELQSYLIGNIEKYLEGKGKKVIGWHEILKGDLTDNVTVMCWGGMQDAVEAVKRGNKVIMSPGGYCYFDAYQDAPPTQPEAMGGYTPLDKVYGFEPVPEGLTDKEAALITGVQGNLWCEFIPTARQAEYMLYPRATAIAEIGWSMPENRDTDDFRQRVLKVNDLMKRNGYYVFDIENEEGQRRESLFDIDHMGKGKKVVYNFPWWNKYNAAFETTLTDGQRGGWGYGDRRWQGFMDYESDRRVDVTIDLGEITPIEYVGADFMQLIEPDIWFPAQVIIQASTDGVNFKELAVIEHAQEALSGLRFKKFEWNGEEKARYVRYVANAPKGCLFTDEIIIR